MLLATAVVYGRSLSFGFVHDDVTLLQRSARLAGDATLVEALTRDLFWLADGRVRPSPYWRPVVTASYFVDQWLGGGRAWVFHLTNLVLVAGVAAVAGLFARGWGAVVVGLTVVAHPLMVEPACNITARTDLWMTLFALLALWMRHPGATFALALLALGSKETAVVLPLVALAVHGVGARRRWAPHVLAVVVWAAARLPLVASYGVAQADRGWPTWESVTAAPVRIGWHLGRLLIPVEPVPSLLLPTPQIGLRLAAWGVLAGGVWLVWRHRQRRWLLVGVAFVVLPLVPVSGLLAAPVRYAEGFCVWPLVGVGLMLAAVPRQWPALTLVPLWLTVSVPAVSHWRSNLALWEAAHAGWPSDPLVAGNLGRIRLGRGDVIGALPLLEQGLGGETDPRRLRELHAAAASALMSLGRPEAALYHLERAVDSLDDPEASWQIEQLCLVGRALDRPVRAACAEAFRRNPGCRGCTPGDDLKQFP